MILPKARHPLGIQAVLALCEADQTIRNLCKLLCFRHLPDLVVNHLKSVKLP